MNLLAASSQPINTLSSEPLSIIIPASAVGFPDVPLPSSINLSLTTVFVVDTVVVVPFTIKLPATVTLGAVNVVAP